MHCIMFACRAVVLHAILILLIVVQKQSSFLTFAFLKTHALLKHFVRGEICRPFGKRCTDMFYRSYACDICK